jgi:hypothetical protein
MSETVTVNSGAKAPDYAWAILELLGRRTLAGRVYEVQRFGSVLGAIDIPDTSPTATPDTFRRTQLFNAGSIYCLTYCTEEAARAAAAQQQRWEQPETHYQALPARTAQEPESEEEYEACEDCGTTVEVDSAVVGPVLCSDCTEDRDRAREVDLQEQGKADDAEADAAAGVAAALEAETTPW